MDRRHITVPHLPESKSSFGSSRGSFCEYLAAEHFIKNHNYIFVTKNLDLYFGEVDLVFIAPDGELVVIEVKSVNEDLAWRAPVARAQRKRLSRVFEHLVSNSVRPVRMHLAAVNQQNEVTVFYDFLADASI